ncbi:SAG1-related sequence 2, related [Neospora caninum Liverpool]|uniref:Srs domain-containing protein n=1 Tax=Neospora caninum (strain Liverpool) TaxID=572307 RepID=F0V8C8_NEOCL|nr:SAG1-related sequence 2, related [Neospora caninum Liverpool]CBZ49969.1 SAG1-related sequence 2, related [Neospora caninum Liverpool]CEL64557.1 TPA: SAG1-related sequence 2, related [Neospora caninum Liverpool]|eukprot:XP_003880004.1 SAG1-related sequence 2, related [Neospora caninum Liverpool]
MARASRMKQYHGELRSKVRKLMAVCLGGVLLISGGGAVAGEPFEGLLRRSLTSGRDGNRDGTAATNSVATCQGKNGSATAPTPATLTLSKSSLTAEVKCLDETNTPAPKGLDNVCVAKTTEDIVEDSVSNDCKFGSDTGRTVTLETLLGANQKIQWTEKNISDSDTGTGTARMLKLNEADLPRTDKTFFVGCKKQAGADANPSCKVTVNVNARPSSVDDKNVVTCAYGEDSNQKAVEVEMSQDKNTLTIDCGKDGSMQPAEFTSQYCSPEGDTLEECSKANYSDILPTFETSWWTEAENDSSPAVLTIPKADFPGEDQRLLLGCAPKSTAAETPGKASGPSGSATTATSCRVVVTVKAASSASSASFTSQTVAATAGATVLPALLAGSF